MTIYFQRLVNMRTLPSFKIAFFSDYYQMSKQISVKDICTIWLQGSEHSYSLSLSFLVEVSHEFDCQCSPFNVGNFIGQGHLQMWSCCLLQHQTMKDPISVLKSNYCHIKQFPEASKEYFCILFLSLPLNLQQTWT